jgi:hypothetical protein
MKVSHAKTLYKNCAINFTFFWRVGKLNPKKEKLLPLPQATAGSNCHQKIS